MKRVLPSTVVEVIREHFGWTRDWRANVQTRTGSQFYGATVMSGILQMIDRIPEELLTMDPTTDARYTLSLSSFENAIAGNSNPECVPLADDKCAKTTSADGAWRFHDYVHVTAQLQEIQNSLYSRCVDAKDYLNLIHPTVAERRNAACDCGTSHITIGTVYSLIEKLERRHSPAP
jgi:hypothetical protein